jgi:cell division septal protein FtsQ
MARAKRPISKVKHNGSSQAIKKLCRHTISVWQRLAAVSVIMITLFYAQKTKIFINAKDEINEHIIVLKPKVREISVSGYNHLSRGEVIKLSTINYGDSLLELDLASIKEKLEKNGWIKKALIKRKLTGEVSIEIQERVPQVAWDVHERLYLLDYHGDIIEKISDASSVSGMIKVKGESGNLDFSNVLDVLSNIGLENPPILLTKIANRRWNIILDSGLEIKLPSENIETSLKDLPLLIKLHQSNPLSYVDLRAAPARIYIKYAVKG